MRRRNSSLIKSTTSRTILVLALLLIVGCSTLPERNAAEDSHKMNPLEVPGLRFWDEQVVDAHNYDVSQELNTLLENKEETDKVIHIAFSGGGVNGAFSAGILNAWTDTGLRPDFDVVTGVSTGAIVSVFAYLGSDYDTDLKHYYTETAIEDMFKRHSMFRLVGGTSFVDTSGFEHKVRDAITHDLMESLAEERERGRLLLIATTNLDSEKMAIWDIGRIAQVGTPSAQALIQDIIIASSSIPGAFPAKLIPLSYEGQEYDELHVDGGVSRQVFLIPQWMHNSLRSSDHEQVIYVVRNGYLNPQFDEVQSSISTVSARSISTLIRRQGIADVEYIYHYSDRNEFAFQLAHIEDDFDEDGLDPTGLAYMNRLFDYGYLKKSESRLWTDRPPSMNE